MSAQVFRYTSKQKRNSITKLNACEDAFIRKAYYGGRNEIYQPIASDVYYYDVNSLYPYIMQKYKLPKGVPIFRDASFFEINKLETFYGFVEVLIEVPKDLLPILPLRFFDSNNPLGVIYPTGVFKGTYFSEELLFAMERGCKILKIFAGYAFQSDILFDTFVDKLYTLRSQTESPFMKKIYKDIMNSLYGRFGSIFEREIIIQDSLNQETICVKKNYNAVSVSAAITGYARIYMYKLQEQLKAKLVYWDTDGFFLKDALPNNQLSTSLSGLRLMYKIDSVVFIAPKMYIYKYNQNQYQYTLKGITVNHYDIDGVALMSQIEYALLKRVTPDKFEYIINFELKNKKDFISFTVDSKRAFVRGNLILITRPYVNL